MAGKIWYNRTTVRNGRTSDRKKCVRHVCSRPAEKRKEGTILKDYGSLRSEIARLALEYLKNILQDDTADYGDYRVEDGEFRFCPRDGIHIPADRVSEWNLSKSGGGKIRFFDKASAIALAKSIGVFETVSDMETEDLSDEALFGDPDPEA